MITENLSTLKIHNLTKEQYERELEAGRIDENALYLTPYEEIDLSVYATTEQVNSAIEEVRADIPEHTWESLPDKPFGEVFTPIFTAWKGDNLDGQWLTDSSGDLYNPKGKILQFTFDNNYKQIVTGTYNYDEHVSTYSDDELCVVFDYEGYASVIGTPNGMKIIKVEPVSSDIKVIAEPYIPDDIARIYDIPEHTWESLPDKPFYAESQMVCVGTVAHSNGKSSVTVDNEMLTGPYSASFHDSEYTFEYIYEFGEFPYYHSDGTSFEVQVDESSGAFEVMITSEHQDCGVEFYVTKTVINYLDESYIPDSIARISDILSLDNTLSVEGSAADAKAVGEAIATKQDSITGTEGQFVVIGADGKPTVKTIPNAEEAEF